MLVAISGMTASAAQAATYTDVPRIGGSFAPAPLSPVSQESAVRRAKEYLQLEAFSRTGLIQQLGYDSFSTEDVTSAVDSLTVDWNEQAAKKAKAYLEMEGFSHDGLVEQLEYDGFTSPQAEYGVSAVGL